MARKIFILAIFISIFSTVSHSGTVVNTVNDSIPEIPILKKLELLNEENGARVIVTNNTHVIIDKKYDNVVKGYRIKLFFDNSQSARAKAEEIKAKFIAKYPQHEAYLQYIAPYFNVMVGDFLTYQEALVFAQKVMKDFPKSFIVPQDIPIKIFGTKKAVEQSDTAK